MCRKALQREENTAHLKNCKTSVPGVQRVTEYELDETCSRHLGRKKLDFPVYLQSSRKQLKRLY